MESIYSPSMNIFLLAACYCMLYVCKVCWFGDLDIRYFDLQTVWWIAFLTDSFGAKFELSVIRVLFCNLFFGYNRISHTIVQLCAVASWRWQGQLPNLNFCLSDFFLEQAYSERNFSPPNSENGWTEHNKVVSGCILKCNFCMQDRCTVWANFTLLFYTCNMGLYKVKVLGTLLILCFLILLSVICSCLSKIAASCHSPNFSAHDAAGYVQWRRQHFIPAWATVGRKSVRTGVVTVPQYWCWVSDLQLIYVFCILIIFRKMCKIKVIFWEPGQGLGNASGPLQSMPRLAARRYGLTFWLLTFWSAANVLEYVFYVLFRLQKNMIFAVVLKWHIKKS